MYGFLLTCFMHFACDQSNGWCLFGKMKAPRIFYSVEMSNPFLCRSSSKFSKHINAAPTTTKKKQQTNQWEKNGQNDSFNIKADTSKKTKQHQTKTERYFLTPYPSSLKLSMYSRHFVGGYLLVDPPPRPSAYLEFPRKVYHESPLK